MRLRCPRLRGAEPAAEPPYAEEAALPADEGTAEKNEAHAEEIFSGVCGEDLTWAFDTETGVITISGTGMMDRFECCGDGFSIYYMPEYAEAWAPNGETEWNGYPIAPYAPMPPATGDMDGDGAVTVSDALIVLRAAMEISTVEPGMTASGDMDGERVRLAFARIFLSDANVLVLDEPTNYLDIPSVEAIQAMLAEYEGTMLFASHDKTFVRAVATDALLIENKKIVEYDLSDY